MSFNNKPITAKIKRTTQGGMVQQPILNMGGPVKMKASSPAKQKGRDRVAASNSKDTPKDTSSEQKRLKAEVKSMSDTLASYKAKGGKVDPRDAAYLEKSQNKLKSLQPKDTSESKGYVSIADMKSSLKPSKVSPPKNTGNAEVQGPKVEGAKVAHANFVYEKPSAKASYTKKGGKATGNIKDYKVGSQARQDEYTARGWKQDSTSTAVNPKAKAVSVTAPAGIKKVEIDTKLAQPPKPKKEVSVKIVRKTKSIDKKQGKADKAKAEGNFKKAARKEKAIDKKEARMAKRNGYQGQGSKAIQPK